MATQASANSFFKSSYYAVVGASTNPEKVGHKVFAWYTTHSLLCTPINPASPHITVSSTDYPTLPSLTSLPHPTTTSVSIITPPAVTKKVLAEAKEVGIRGVWLQPGSYDDEILKGLFSGEEGGFEVVVGGEGKESKGAKGWCVLVDGEGAIEGAKA